ncbi:MAG: site-specific DNA-methyltransferase, partial [Peptoniphilus harei]|nr:site-specific DNA-methyltransferase [Peptoniphilus harei]
MNPSIKTNYIINLDALSALKEFPENLFNTCITSPPYYGLRDYHHESQIGREDSPEAYLNNLVEVFRQVRRVLKEDGSLWLVIGDLYASTKSKEERPAYKPKDLMGLPWQLALKLR